MVPIHPELAEALEDILGDTYGLIVYQVQVMAIAQKLAGYTLGAADLLRRAMGKKKKEILDKEYVPFSEGMKANGYSAAAIKTLWDILVPFSDYAFNKAHTAGYGLIAYWTAYLKANYAPEYMAALLTSVGDDKDKSAVYLAECRRMGIKVLPPDVNASTLRFTAVGNDIRFGLGAVRNVGVNVVEAIIRCRKEKGDYTDFYDYLRKVDQVACNKKSIESLIKAGAFDSMGHTRKGLLAVHADAIDAFIGVKKNEAVGQFDLFGSMFDDGDASNDPGLVVTPPSRMTVVRLPFCRWTCTSVSPGWLTRISLSWSTIGAVHRVIGIVRVTGLLSGLCETSGMDMSIAMIRAAPSRRSIRPLTTTIASSAMNCPISS